MVGDIEDAVKEYIESLDICVRFFSFVAKNGLICFYHAADIILIPSFYDGMPNVLLEAGASKKLVVASNVGGISDVIEDGVDGYLFNPLQSSNVLEVLGKLHKLSEEKRAEMANALYQKIKLNYTEEKEINNYLNQIKL